MIARLSILFAGLLVLIGAPLVLGPYATGVLTNALVAALFATAFNLLSGQAGMLSFGHAAYFALGGFAVIHAMRAVEAGWIVLPVPLLPLVGGLGGLVGGLCAAVFATRRSGVYFSMVTLALAELMHGLAPSLSGLFGGEVGLSSMRAPWLALDFGSERQVYYVVMIWAVICILLLYLYNWTLFGRLTVALRESERRLSFLGFDPYRTKIIVFAVSAMFSGIAGGLLAVSSESINYSSLSLGTSAAVILHTFVGGASVFLGPALGAVIFTFLGSFVSDLTRNWLLYQGALFVVIMMFMNGGLASLAHDISGEIGGFKWRPLLLRVQLLVPGLLAAGGVVFLLELISRLMGREYQGALAATGAWGAVRLFGTAVSPADPFTWVSPFVAILVGAGLIWRIRSKAREAPSPPGPATVGVAG